MVLTPQNDMPECVRVQRTHATALLIAEPAVGCTLLTRAGTLACCSVIRVQLT